MATPKALRTGLAAAVQSEKNKILVTGVQLKLYPDMHRSFLTSLRSQVLRNSLVDHLIEQGHKVVVLDNFPTGSVDNLKHLRQNPNLEFLQ